MKVGVAFLKGLLCTDMLPVLLGDMEVLPEEVVLLLGVLCPATVSSLIPGTAGSSAFIMLPALAMAVAMLVPPLIRTCGGVNTPWKKDAMNTPDMYVPRRQLNHVL